MRRKFQKYIYNDRNQYGDIRKQSGYCVDYLKKIPQSILEETVYC